MTKKQLPILDPMHALPTGKHHVSFSEITDHTECSYRHKLKYIDKILLDGGSIHTAFGTALHDTAEKYLTYKHKPDGKEALKLFKANLEELDLDAQIKALEIIPEFIENLPDMVGQIPDWIDETFPGWQIVEAEQLLYETVDKQEHVYFKGFIDAVIKVPKKITKKAMRLSDMTASSLQAEPEWVYYLLDWKTTSWGWKADQKRSFEKQMQLILYKHYFCQTTGVDPKDVRCGFVLIKRQTKKARSKHDRMELIPISVGPKAIEKALKVVDGMINQVKAGYYSKNRRHCEPFCPYHLTPHCL